MHIIFEKSMHYAATQCGMARKRNIHGVFLLWINVLEEHTSLKSIAFPCTCSVINGAV